MPTGLEHHHPRSASGRAPPSCWKLWNEVENAVLRGLFSETGLIRSKSPYCVLAEGFFSFAVGTLEEKETGVCGSSDPSWSLAGFLVRLCGAVAVASWARVGYLPERPCER